MLFKHSLISDAHRVSQTQSDLDSDMGRGRAQKVKTTMHVSDKQQLPAEICRDVILKQSLEHTITKA